MIRKKSKLANIMHLTVTMKETRTKLKTMSLRSTLYINVALRRIPLNAFLERSKTVTTKINFSELTSCCKIKKTHHFYMII